MERLPLERICPLDEEPGRQEEKVDHRGTSIKKNSSFPGRKRKPGL
jgi:hypothetical protein